MARPKILRLGIISLAAILVAGVSIYLCLPKEPRYQGRTLSAWIYDGYDSQHWGNASNAVQHIGTNAIPFFLKWASAKDSRSKQTILLWQNQLLPERFRFRSASEKQLAAHQGWRLLGDEARLAWPVLIQWTFDPQPDRRRIGLETLMDSKANKATMLPVFRRMLDDTDKGLQREAASYFYLYYRNEAVAADIFKRVPGLSPPPVSPPHDAGLYTNQPPPAK